MTNAIVNKSGSVFNEKIVFFGSTNLSLPILEVLRQKYEIVMVVTTPDAEAGRKRELQETPVSALAKDLKLVLNKPEHLKNNTQFFDTLKNLNADLFVVVAYGKILPNEFINLPKYKTLNVHPSLLPKYRGSSPIRTALLNGDTVTGVSFILLDDQIDHGSILKQLTLAIDQDDNDFLLTNKFGHVAAQAINQLIENYVNGKITPQPQDDSAATFTKIISKADGEINWNKTAAEIYNQFRALYLWPGIWTKWNGKLLKITDCTLFPTSPPVIRNRKEGEVSEGGIIACGKETFLQIKTLQLEGKKEMKAGEFINGYREFVGSQLK